MQAHRGARGGSLRSARLPVCSRTMRMPALALLSLAVFASACSGREDNEARIFLDRVTLIHHDAPAADRRRAIDALEQLPLTSEDLVGVRDTCVRGHRALLEAEAEQADAAQALGRLTGGRDDVAIPRSDAAEIEAAILRSNDAIEQARLELTRCQDEVADLDRRYSKRR